MGIGQPGVKRHRRQLDRKGDEKAEHQPKRGGGAHLRAEQRQIVEGEVSGRVLVNEDEHQDRDQHDEAAALGEDEELDRGIKAALVAPQRDQEIHRHQHQFPEEEEEEQIQGEEHADHACRCPEQVGVKKANPIGDLGPGDHHRDEAERDREQDEDQAQTVETKLEGDAQLKESTVSRDSRSMKCDRKPRRGR